MSRRQLQSWNGISVITVVQRINLNRFTSNVKSTGTGHQESIEFMNLHLQPSMLN